MTRRGDDPLVEAIGRVLVDPRAQRVGHRTEHIEHGLHAHLGLATRLKQCFHAFAGLCRDVDEQVLAAPGLGDHLVLGEFVADPLRVGVLADREFLQ